MIGRAAPGCTIFDMDGIEAVRGRIKDELDAITEENGVEVLYACESGSRAWGFESTNSDFDVRFIFRHPVERYVALDEPLQQIDRMLNTPAGVLDISGWDLLKSLRLLRTRNPALIEWIRSPFVLWHRTGAPAAIAAAPPVPERTPGRTEARNRCCNSA